jgi:hypothetical protein
MEIHKKNNIPDFFSKNQIIEQRVSCRIVKEEVVVEELQTRMLPGRIAEAELGYMPRRHAETKGLLSNA